MAVIRVNHKNICIACDVGLDLYLEEQVCSCFEGFSLAGNQCSEVCGDGKLFQLDCDDGNSNNGDGCSETCHIEQYYIC